MAAARAFSPAELGLGDGEERSLTSLTLLTRGYSVYGLPDTKN